MALLPPIYGPTQQKTLIQLANDNTAPDILESETNWLRGAISGVHWNKQYPYQFIIVEPDGLNSYAPKSGLGTTFTLPIPPQSLTVSVPFAIQTYMTLDGIIEENNGAPVRMISLTGTTGVLPGGKASNLAKTQSPIESIFAGTIAQAKTTIKDFKQLLDGQTFTVNAYDAQSFDQGGELEKLTGFFQFRLLQQFFDYYAELKKTPEGRKARLAFAMYKDEAVYLCQPMSFNLNRSAGRPLEYVYDIQLKATKRVRLSQGVVQIASDFTPVTKQPSELAKILNTMQQARLVLQGAKQTILAVRGDVNHTVFEPIREVALFCKDALSIPLSLADLSDSIIQDAKSTVLLSINTIQSIKNFKSNFEARFGQVDKNLNGLLDSLGVLAAEFKTTNNIELKQSAILNTHPANNPFTSPSDNFKFFSSINVGNIRPGPVLTSKVATERARVSKFTRLDFQKRRDTIAEVAAQYANAIGMGDSTYNQLYGIADTTVLNINTPTNEDYNVIFALNDVIMQLDGLAATTNSNDSNALVDSIASVAGMAHANGIAFKIPVSKFAVPFPYGYNLELLALRYLKDPNRWFEIAALNGLQAPWVDEVGFDLVLLANGFENRVSVSDASQLFIGQPIWLVSNAVPKEVRHITKIDKINDSQFIITVDGNLDLAKFTTIGGSLLHAYLPDTVNSQQTIFIPSDRQPQDPTDFLTKAIPGVDQFDTYIKVGGVDLLLTPNGDVVIGPDGDTRWSIGLNNVVQQVRLAISVRKGKLLGHPEFGLPIDVGMSIADFNKQDLIRSLQSMFAGNSTFSGVTDFTIKLNGPSLDLKIGVKLAGTTQNIPISMSIT